MPREGTRTVGGASAYYSLKGEKDMGWAERLNLNSERNIERYNNSAARERHREANEKKERDGPGGASVVSLPRSPLFAYGRAVLRDAKMRRRSDKIITTAAKLEASTKRAKETEGTEGTPCNE
jgi:hypothetical protein